MEAKIRKQLYFLGKELLDELINSGQQISVPVNQELIVDGQYVKMLPLVIEGAIKVYIQSESKDLLLYYIREKESCIMSFSAIMQNEKSKIFAQTIKDSEILLIPANKLPKLVVNYPQLNNLFYKQYDLRYADLLQTIKDLIFYKLDQRILKYLQQRSKNEQEKVFKITHKEIAEDLGTAREVVSRVLKKLEKEKLISQNSGEITIL